MKKYLLFCPILLSSFAIQSQTLMTWGEIHDFNVGDIFQRSYTTYTGPPTLQKTTITAKYYSTALDTVFYVYNLYSYTSPVCPPPCTFSSYSTTGNIFAYTNLNDTIGDDYGAKPYNLSCIDSTGYTGSWHDSTYYDSSFCNKLITNLQWFDGALIEQSPGCFGYFEAGYGEVIYGKGIGKKSYYYTDCSFGGSPCQWYENLFYYKKGIDSCGTSNPILNNPIYTSVTENNSIKKKIHIFPNPTAEKITISENYFKLQLLNELGQVVKEVFETNEIDISNLPQGAYLVKLYDSNDAFLGAEKIIKVQKD